jgi:hypothetical protein
MYNLLPDEQKDAIKREYHFRVAIIASRFVLLATIVGFVFLIPSFVLLFTKRSELTDQITASERVQAETTKEVSVDSTKQLNEEVEILKGVNLDAHPEELIKKVFDSRPKNIQISKAVYGLVGTSSSVSIEGVANSIDDLLVFKKVLLTIPPFKSATFPVELLTKRSNVSFVITAQ